MVSVKIKIQLFATEPHTHFCALLRTGGSPSDATPCAGLCASIAELPEAWEEWWSMEHPELTPLPGEFEELHDLTSAARALALRFYIENS